MGDPFLRSSDEPFQPAGNADDDLRRRSGLPREVFDLVPRADVERFVSRVESWAGLEGALDRALVSAGFHRHDPGGAGSGGFNIATWLRDDGVVVSWAVAGRSSNPYDTFEDRVESIMNPALAAVLTEIGFDVEIVPADQDDAGCLLVSGFTGTGANS
ncbi:hypothetical protein SMC26_21460 [Actinomadura fulvescens]